MDACGQYVHKEPQEDVYPLAHDPARPDDRNVNSQDAPEREVALQKRPAAPPALTLPGRLFVLTLHIGDDGIDEAIHRGPRAHAAGKRSKMRSGPHRTSSGTSCWAMYVQALRTRRPNVVASYTRRGSPPASGGAGSSRDRM